MRKGEKLDTATKNLIRREYITLAMTLTDLSQRHMVHRNTVLNWSQKEQWDDLRCLFLVLPVLHDLLKYLCDTAQTKNVGSFHSVSEPCDESQAAVSENQQIEKAQGKMLNSDNAKVPEAYEASQTNAQEVVQPPQVPTSIVEKPVQGPLSITSVIKSDQSENKNGFDWNF